MHPKPIQDLVDLFSKFPTIGPKTASRFVFYLLKKPKSEIQELIGLIGSLKEEIRVCNFCFNPFSIEAHEKNLCPICMDPRRNRKILCIVEKETDLISIENTGKYKGLYFILGGTLSKFKKEHINELRTNELLKRLAKPSAFGIRDYFEEIILALNPTPEGEATALYLERLFKNLPPGLKITRLGKGLPVGGELEYADEETLTSALESRR